jgi:glucokinase
VLVVHRPAHANSFIGLDVGGTFLKGALIDRDGAVIERLHQPVAKATADELFEQLTDAIRTLQKKETAGAVGIGLPGIVDQAGARLRVAPNVPVLNGLPVGHEIERRTGRRTFLENDANAAALAEAWLGAGHGAENLLFVTLGTGIGAGVVMGGRVWSGASGYAGELGHIQVDPDGIRCGCGSWGCVETVAGAPNWGRVAETLLAGRSSSLSDRELDPEVITDAAKSGDAVALEVVQGVARALGSGIAAALNLLNVERVVIGGGVAAAGPFLLDRISEEARRRLFAQTFADSTFCLAELGADAGVIGAARAGMVALAR